ncbi:MAG: anthrone oxygenase family protein [Acidobacteriota bacterium]
MEPLEIGLVTAALLCSLVAGLVFAFASVAMPGLGTLGDREFLRAFQVIDRVIQNNQPLFMLVWVGSALTLGASAVLGFWRLEGLDLVLLMIAAAVYFAGVQAPTAAINIPLNNRLQTLELETMDDRALAEARAQFEPRWNRWNQIRTVLATLTSALLILLVLRL